MNKPIFTAIALIALASITSAQSTDITSLIRQAQDRSSHVKAAQAIVDARRASLGATRSLTSPVLELSPGVGFTNGNTVLSQEFDLFGRRSAATQLAEATLKVSELDIVRARADVSLEVLKTLAALLASEQELEISDASVKSAKALLAAVTKQHEIGEAPKVHVTRAELDVLRATQQLTQAKGRFKLTQAAMESVLGTELSAQNIRWPDANLSPAPAASFELLSANLEFNVAEAQARVTRTEYAPTFSAGLASDVWSLDRNQFRRDNFGLQISFRMPLYDSGQRRGILKSSELEIAAARSRVEEARRKANLRFVEATQAYETARLVAANYEGDVLPKGEAMLTAMREGYAAGLVTLVEVLEAQQTLMKLRQEQVQATLNLRLAEIDLWNAQLTLPGVEVSR